MDNKRALSAIEVSEILHVSKNTVYELIRRGEINSYKVGRKIRFTREDVDDYIARFRHEKPTAPVNAVSAASSLFQGAKSTGREWIISGQDVLLDLLSNHLRQRNVSTLRAYVASFESILSLYQDSVQIATAHLWDADSDSYNVPYVRRLMPGTHAVLVNLSYRYQGFYVKEGNPKKILDWKDLTREDVKMLNRKKGSGSRILLDEKLMQLKLSKEHIRGYDEEIGSHLTLASSIAKGEADVGLGTGRIVRQIDGLEFIPLQEERYDMVMKKDFFEGREAELLLQTLRSKEYRKEIEGISGNDYRDLGRVMAEV